MQLDSNISPEKQDLALQDLACLYEITKSLASATRLQDCLENVVNILADMKGMENGTVTIINPVTRELEIEVAHGITAEARKRGKYKLGEGITGRVVATGEPIIVPQIGEEPLFLNRTRTRGDEQKKKSSFLCVPIKAASRSIGALSIDRVYEQGFGSQSEQDLRFLTVISGLISQTVQRIQAVNEEKEALSRENSRLKRELSARNRIKEIIGNSSRMQEVFEMVHRVADSNATVLLRGESGTGKTLVAKALHYNSGRAQGPFVVVNCSALPETLLESELFGHEKGAFTGANERKKGRFELAEGGTLFLDEIGEISLAVQVKLLNVIQERTFQRLGGASILKANIRLVAATNRDLEKAVREGHFREDLYYRLNVVVLEVPPLRRRSGDIPLLTNYFIEKYAAKNNRQVAGITPECMDIFNRYPWPGNVRELENAVERGVILMRGNYLDIDSLPLAVERWRNDHGRDQADGPATLREAERLLIIKTLKETGGNKSEAARRLQISRKTLSNKLHSYGIAKRGAEK